MSIKEKKDRKGSHDVVSGHHKTEQGTILIPSSTGATKGAQLGRDHTKASPQVVMGPDGPTGVIQPNGSITPATTEEEVAEALRAASASEQPQGLPKVPVEEETPPEASEGATASADDRDLLDEGPVPPRVSDHELARILEALAPVLDKQASPDVPAANPPAALDVKPPRVRVTVKSLSSPAIRWRGRYHGVVAAGVGCVVLYWDTRFEYADSPLLPFESSDVVELDMTVQDVGGEIPGTAERFRVAYAGLSFEFEEREFFVFPISGEPEA